jgi:hypothetical protein
MEALEIRLSEEIMSEVDDACPLDIEFPPIMHFGGRIRRRRRHAATPFMSAQGDLDYLEWVRPITVRWKEKACEVERLGLGVGWGLSLQFSARLVSPHLLTPGFACQPHAGLLARGDSSS